MTAVQTSLFLKQEPTSGLDYSTAFSLVRTMRSITEAQNKTVIMTIHQPSSQMFFSFHNLLLLCDGQVGVHCHVGTLSCCAMARWVFTVMWEHFPVVRWPGGCSLSCGKIFLLCDGQVGVHCHVGTFSCCAMARWVFTVMWEHFPVVRWPGGCSLSCGNIFMYV